MTTYRKRPIEVEAIRWTGDNLAAVARLLAEHATDEARPLETEAPFDTASPDELYVVTVEGNRVRVPVGAYVVIDGKGYAYPCDGELFDRNHEPVAAGVTAETETDREPRLGLATTRELIVELQARVETSMLGPVTDPMLDTLGDLETTLGAAGLLEYSTVGGIPAGGPRPGSPVPQVWHRGV